MSNGLARRSLQAEAVSPAKLVQNLLIPAYFKQKWPSLPPHTVGVDGFADPGLLDADFNFHRFQSLGSMIAFSRNSGAKTAANPTEDANNGFLDAGLDQAAAEGVQYVFGGKQTQYNPFGVQVGNQDSPYPGNKFVKLLMGTDTVANVAECALGFRKGEAAQAAIDDYDEMAVLNMQAGDVVIETILNGAATEVTDTGIDVADGDTWTFEVRMDGREPRFFVNGREFNTSFLFDSDEIIVPFMFWLQGGGAAQLRWYELTLGNEADEDESLQF
jgi:hypothetical protein